VSTFHSFYHPHSFIYLSILSSAWFTTMSAIKSLFFASALALHVASAPLAPRDLSCPAANGTIYSAGDISWTIECGIDRYLGDMPAPNGQHADTLEACINQCIGRSGCILVDYEPSAKACHVKSSVGHTIENAGVIGALASTASTARPASQVANAAKSSPSTSTSSGLIGASSGKRGLCYNDASLTKLFGGSGSKVTWAYDWAQTPGSGINSGLVYIPMLWNNNAESAASWASNANAAISAGADTLLGFNEPDLPTQANMDVGTAVSAWKQYMQPFAGKVKLASPAVTNGGSPMGLTYLRNFISSCSGCTIDVCAIHWYGSATSVDYFKSYIADAYAVCGNKPIWITEFSAGGSESQVETFLNTVLPWLDSNYMVQRYAYFMVAPSSDGTYLVNGAGTGLSNIGQIYNAA
jgi:hypothetical protein